MKTLITGEFSGYLKINFSQGSLGRVEKSEEFENAEVILAEEKNGKITEEKKNLSHDFI